MGPWWKGSCKDVQALPSCQVAHPEQRRCKQHCTVVALRPRRPTGGGWYCGGVVFIPPRFKKAMSARCGMPRAARRPEGLHSSDPAALSRSQAGNRLPYTRGSTRRQRLADLEIPSWPSVSPPSLAPVVAVKLELVNGSPRQPGSTRLSHRSRRPRPPQGSSHAAHGLHRSPECSHKRTEQRESAQRVPPPWCLWHQRHRRSCTPAGGSGSTPAAGRPS